MNANIASCTICGWTAEKPYAPRGIELDVCGEACDVESWRVNIRLYLAGEIEHVVLGPSRNRRTLLNEALTEKFSPLTAHASLRTQGA